MAMPIRMIGPADGTAAGFMSAGPRRSQEKVHRSRDDRDDHAARRDEVAVRAVAGEFMRIQAEHECDGAR